MSDWIPISKKLPEINQKVLVTSYGRVCYAMMTSADGNSGHPVFRLQDSLNERVVCETTAHNPYTEGRIIAWMPLPEPYEKGTSGIVSHVPGRKVAVQYKTPDALIQMYAPQEEEENELHNNI